MIANFAIALFAAAGLLATVRLLIGPSLADRIIALDTVLVSLMGGIAVDAARRENGTNLIMLVVLAIIGFTATMAAARFIEHQKPQHGGAA
ncbi:MAG: monovalent cation/H+ antiporter complex subunit F [Actinomycetota bacterium]